MLQVPAGQIFGDALEPIDDRWIALQGDLPLQAIMEYSRNQRPLRGKSSLFFDDRGQGHDLVNIPPPPPGLFFHGWREAPMKLVHHSQENLSLGRARGKVIRGGE